MRGAPCKAPRGAIWAACKVPTSKEHVFESRYYYTIVLDRLKTDFENSKIFYQDPIIPPDTFEGKNWRSDFKINTHIY